MSQGLVILLLAVSSFTAFAQDQQRLPLWGFGAAAGLNENIYNEDGGQVSITGGSPVYPKGSGLGLFLAPMIEFRPQREWGGMLQVGFDSRRALWTPQGFQGPTSDLTTSLSYISIEPAVRLTDKSTPVYVYAGPTLGFNVTRGYSYTPLAGGAEIEGEISDWRAVLLGGQLGLGYDFALSPGDAGMQSALSPFLSLHIGQSPTLISGWSLTTIRAGVVIKFSSSWKPKRDADLDDRPPLAARSNYAGKSRVENSSLACSIFAAQPECLRYLNDVRLQI